ncbi:hypothetical protein, partial [Xanthomonas hortorum]|uniref:hypothetical protein n=1 Tax=Xanthomonas hortorum TaxID=56454 RepID=UPI0032E85BE9
QTQHQPAVHPFGLLGTITQKIVNRFLGVTRGPALLPEVMHRLFGNTWQYDIGAPLRLLVRMPSGARMPGRRFRPRM